MVAVDAEHGLFNRIRQVVSSQSLMSTIALLGRCGNYTMKTFHGVLVITHNLS